MITSPAFIIKHVYFVTLFLALTGCARPNMLTYTPMENITFKLVLKNFEPKKDHKSIFLYFDLEIKNDSTKLIYFNPGEIKASLDGIQNESVYYDSLASVMPEKKELTRGVSNYRLYFVFNDPINQNLESFDIINFGLN